MQGRDLGERTRWPFVLGPARRCRDRPQSAPAGPCSRRRAATAAPAPPRAPGPLPRPTMRRSRSMAASPQPLPAAQAAAAAGRRRPPPRSDFLAHNAVIERQVISRHALCAADRRPCRCRAAGLGQPPRPLDAAPPARRHCRRPGRRARRYLAEDDGRARQVHEARAGAKPAGAVRTAPAVDLSL